MMAQGAAPKGVTNSKLLRLLAYNGPPNCADVQIGDSALVYEAPNRKSLPERRGAARILEFRWNRGVGELAKSNVENDKVLCA